MAMSVNSDLNISLALDLNLIGIDDLKNIIHNGSGNYSLSITQPPQYFGKISKDPQLWDRFYYEKPSLKTGSFTVSLTVFDNVSGESGTCSIHFTLQGATTGGGGGTTGGGVNKFDDRGNAIPTVGIGAFVYSLSFGGYSQPGGKSIGNFYGDKKFTYDSGKDLIIDTNCSFVGVNFSNYFVVISLDAINWWGPSDPTQLYASSISIPSLSGSPIKFQYMSPIGNPIFRLTIPNILPNNVISYCIGFVEGKGFQSKFSNSTTLGPTGYVSLVSFTDADVSSGKSSSLTPTFISYSQPGGDSFVYASGKKEYTIQGDKDLNIDFSNTDVIGKYASNYFFVVYVSCDNHTNWYKVPNQNISIPDIPSNQPQ